MPLPFFSGGSIVTLVIESVAVRLLVVRDNEVVKWASAPLEEGWSVEGTIQQPEEVGRITAELFQAQGVSRKRVVTCVPGAHAVHKIFSLPAMRPADLPNAVIYQAKREMPLPMEELAFTWQLLGSSEGHSEIFGIGVPRDVIGVFMETLRQADVRPKAIDVKPLALARVVNRGTALIGNVEPDSVDVVYLSDYAPVLMRSVYFPDLGTSPAVFAERLVVELQQSLRFYNESSRQQPVGGNTPVFLSGGATDYFSLVEALYGSLEYTIERLNPTLTCPPDFPIEEYATNLGLALKGK